MTLTSESRCYFLDVGQGHSTVIILPNDRAIVIDGGSSADVPLWWLRSQGVKRLELVLVSHNDADHSGGIAGILAAYANHGELGRLLFVQDRNPSEIRWLTAVREGLAEPMVQRILAAARRLEVSERGQVAWESGDASLRIYYPSFIANLDAQGRSDANRSSAVVMFSFGRARVLLPGDAPIGAWRQIHDEIGPISCDLLACPHHGGSLSRAAVEMSDLRWLYGTAVTVEGAAIISVGTNNNYGHPRREVVGALREAGVNVMCTEITTRCCANLDRFAGVPGRKGPRTENNGVACAGTIEATLTRDGVHLSTLDSHRRCVDRLATSDRPLCRL